MKTLEKEGYEITPEVLPSTTVDTLLTLIQANPHNDGFGVA